MSARRNYAIPVSNGIFEHRRKIGSAVWVFLWCIDHTTKEIPSTDGKVEGLVFGGQPVPLNLIASDLEMSWDAVQEHLSQLTKSGYLRKIRQGNGRPNGYAVANSKRFASRQTPGEKPIGTPGEKPIGTYSEKPRDLSTKTQEPIDKNPHVDKEEVLQDHSRQRNTTGPDDSSIAVRLLCDASGRYDIRFQADRTEQVKAEARKRGISAKAVADLMISQWQTYKAATPRLQYTLSSAERFWTSGTWDDQAAWPWKEQHRPQSKTVSERRYARNEHVRA